MRPLVSDPNSKNTQSISRNHVIEVSKCKMSLIFYNLCYFPSGLISHREPHSYNTRTFHSLSLLQPFAHSNYYLHSFVPKTIGDWNSDFLLVILQTRSTKGM